MSRRGESIFKRKDGRWEARYPTGKNDKGKTLYHSVYARSYKEAKEKRNMYIVASAAEENSAKAMQITFREVLQLWLKSNRAKLKEQTCEKYNSCMDNHIIPCLGDMEFAALTSTVVNDFLYQKQNSGRLDGKGGLSKNYVRMISIIVNSAISFGIAEGFRPPMGGKLYKPKIEKKHIRALQPWEQSRLENALGSDLHGAGLAIYLSLHTGLRIGEICSLRWSDIDFQSKMIHVKSSVARLDQNGKTRIVIGSPKTASSNRVIPLTNCLAEILSAEYNQSKSVFVVGTVAGDCFLSPRTLENRYKAILKRAGISPVPFHSLRHTFATRCIESGMDIKSLSEILGHSSVSITLDIYVHPSMELKRTCMERLEAVSGQPFGQIK